MSDRIDELVAAIDANTLLQWNGKDVALEAAHELATIAREAEHYERKAAWLKGELLKSQAEADNWRKVAEAALARSEQKYRTVLESTSEGFWMTDLCFCFGIGNIC